MRRIRDIWYDRKSVNTANRRLMNDRDPLDLIVQQHRIDYVPNVIAGNICLRGGRLECHVIASFSMAFRGDL
jgi:hypothetical protein